MTTQGQGPTVPSVLLPEILRFSPQLLLDDIINFANEAITNAVDGLEEFLFRWATDREQRINEDWDSTQEVEQGLVAFQTLLEYHTDIAFDFFETWSLRNIFAIPADLPIVVPHQEGLELTYPPERETELMSEIDELRKKIDAQRRLKRLLTRSVRWSAALARRSETQLNQLSFLQSPQLRELGQVPDELESMFLAISSLPALTPESTAALIQLPLADPGKRPWETSKSAYFDWATKQLLARVKQQTSGTGDTTIASLAKLSDTIANSHDMNAMVETSAESSGRQERSAEGE
ncbi:Mis12-domain-containing protein [Butyriboletus roseoflavus]|nr:Mis12-domain-containing protein [Butyriboletus roseoflavus]